MYGRWQTLSRNSLLSLRVERNTLAARSQVCGHGIGVRPPKERKPQTISRRSKLAAEHAQLLETPSARKIDLSTSLLVSTHSSSVDREHGTRMGWPLRPGQHRSGDPSVPRGLSLVLRDLSEFTFVLSLHKGSICKTTGLGYLTVRGRGCNCTRVCRWTRGRRML